MYNIYRSYRSYDDIMKLEKFIYSKEPKKKNSSTKFRTGFSHSLAFLCTIIINRIFFGHIIIIMMIAIIHRMFLYM